MTEEYTLRAMAFNYRNGHSWDHLDGEACSKAADEIARLRKALGAILANHETVGACFSIFQCTTAEVNAARKALRENSDA